MDRNGGDYIRRLVDPIPDTNGIHSIHGSGMGRMDQFNSLGGDVAPGKEENRKLDPSQHLQRLCHSPSFSEATASVWRTDDIPLHCGVYRLRGLDPETQNRTQQICPWLT